MATRLFGRGRAAPIGTTVASNPPAATDLLDPLSLYRERPRPGCDSPRLRGKLASVDDRFHRLDRLGGHDRNGDQALVPTRRAMDLRGLALSPGDHRRPDASYQRQTSVRHR